VKQSVNHANLEAPLPEPSEPAPSADPPPAPDNSENAVAPASYESPATDDPAAVGLSSELASPTEAVPSPGFVEANRTVELSPRAIRREPTTGERPADQEPAPSETFEARYQAIHLELTLAVAQDLSRWRLGPLQDRATQLRDAAASAEDRHRAESLSASVAGFERLHQRYREYARARSSLTLPAGRQSPAEAAPVGLFSRGRATPQ
jgi:hypothetical protein